MELMWLDTLHGHCWITLNGGWVTHQGLALSMLISKPSRDTLRCQHTGSSNSLPKRSTNSWAEHLLSKLLVASDNHVLVVLVELKVVL